MFCPERESETGNLVKVAERNALRQELNQILTDMGDFMEVGVVG